MATNGRTDGERPELSDTIYALSSGTPPAAIAVVRVSGPKADAALAALAGSLPEPRTARLATLRRGSEVLDNALIIRFPGPRSATGQDVAELHLHGGRSVVAAVLAALGAIEGLREAAPGEFTRRAFENGRIDLAEAEGLADLLEAETEAQRRTALSLAGGALSRQIAAWQARLLELSAEVEAVLDFSDEADVAPTGFFVEGVMALAAELADWLARPSAERLREGVRVVIAGPPNSGKSSLLNALAGRDAAITSTLPGTTRDVIEAPVTLAGLPFLLIDTAGLRESTDEIETIGIDRARRNVETADIVLWLGDRETAPAGALKVRSKRDILGVDPDADLSVSSMTGEGLDELVQSVARRASGILPNPGEVALNRRHRRALHEAAMAIEGAARATDWLIVADELRHARMALDRITGRAGVEDMLDTLFARFCIGK